MEENEFTPKSDQKSADLNSKTTTKKDGKKEKIGSSKVNIPFLEKIDNRKVKLIFGSVISLLSIYLFLACVSYLFTWEIDQDKLLNRTFTDFLFDSNSPASENWLGKFGAWTSHMLIYRLFGLTSIGLCFLMFLFGIKILFNIALFPIIRTNTIVFSYIIWGSVFFGFFATEVNYLGGTFGYYLNEWLVLALGQFGTLTLILGSFFVVTTLLFSPNYKALFAYLLGNQEKNLVQESYNSEPEVKVFDDIHVVNSIREDQIQEDVVSETVDFSKKNDDDYLDELEFNESELIVTVKDQSQDLNTQIDTDFEFEIGGEIEEEKSTVERNQIQQTENFKLDEDDLATGLVEQFGEYDPTKDLEGYMLPPIELMKDYGSSGVSINKEEIESNKDRIVQTLSHYKIDIARIKATVGPTVTLYEIVPAPGIRISKIKNLEDDIALSLSALGIRIIAPIPGKGTIGIEVPNSNPEMVSMRSLIASEKFQNFDGELPVVMGKTITNETFVFDLTKMPHLLVAGSTGQGKSVGLNAILISILYKKHPAQVKFVLVDPKKVELTLYNKIERHFLAKLPGEEDAIITDTSKVVNTLNSLCVEMDERYELLKDAGVRTIKEYNVKFIGRRLNPEKGHRFLPYIVVLIDEFADLIMTAGKEVEHPIARIAQLARAIGIHLIVATQRPSVNVITGMIKANFPARIAFRVLSKIDSRTILDASGADQLIGRGDMLISTGSDMKRLQCGFVDTPEVEEICSFIGNQRAYPEALILPEYTPEGSDGGADFDMNEIDPMFVDSARIVVINQQGSASLLQRKLKLGYNRAGRIVDQLEGMGIIGAFQGSKAREVLFGDVESLDEFMRTKGLL